MSQASTAAHRTGFVLFCFALPACLPITEPELGRLEQSLGLGMFPKTPESNEAVLIYDFRFDDGRSIDYLADDIATARALQGLVNRVHPRIYVIASEHEAQWVSQIGRATTTISSSSAGEPLLERMFSDQKGAMRGRFLIYDVPSNHSDDWSFPLALTAAAIEDGLPVTEAIFDRLKSIINPGVDPVTFRTASFSSRTQAYEWAAQTLLPRTGVDAVFLLRQGTFRLYDYAVATRGFVFHLDWTNPDERALARKILSDPRYASSAPTPLLGYYFDSQTINDPNCTTCKGDSFSVLAAESGLYGMGADFFGNASFWSQFPRSTPTQQRRAFSVRAVPGRIYTSLFLSDGDNFQHNQNFMRAWLGDGSTGLNAGISVNPGLIDLAPPILDFAHANIGPDLELIAGPNGLGYSFPSLNPDIFGATYRRWITDNGEYMKASELLSAQLWRDGVASGVLYGGMLPYSDGSIAINYLRRQPSLAGVLLGDRRSPDGSLAGQVHVYGDRVAADSIAVTADAPQFLAAMNELHNNGRSGYFALQIRQQSGPSQFRATLDSLNSQGSRVVPLTPHDWFKSVQAEYLSMNHSLSETRDSYVLHGFKTAAGGHALPEEAMYLVHDLNMSAIDDDHRYADMHYSWSYDVAVPRSARRIRIRADVRGDCKITVTNTMGVSDIHTFHKGTDRGWVDFQVSSMLLPSSRLRVKFEDATPSTGLGPSLWEFELSLGYPEAAEVTTASEWTASPNAWSYQGEMSCWCGIDVDHLYVDRDAWMTFSIPVQPLRRNTIEFDVAGQFLLQVSPVSPLRLGCAEAGSGPAQWTTVAGAVFPDRETVSVDVTDLAASSSGTLYLRFRDLRPADGHGASVWRIKTIASDLLSVAYFDHRAFRFAPGVSSPEERALLAPAACNSGYTNGHILEGAIVADGHRFADGFGVFTYRLQFPQSSTQAFVSLEVGGEYEISVAPETTLEPECPSAFSVLASATGVTPRNRLSLDLSDALIASGARKAVYLRFGDRTTTNGNGPSLSGLRAFAN